MRNCPSCNTPVEDGEVRCPHCGWLMGTVHVQGTGAVTLNNPKHRGTVLGAVGLGVGVMGIIALIIAILFVTVGTKNRVEHSGKVIVVLQGPNGPIEVEAWIDLEGTLHIPELKEMGGKFEVIEVRPTEEPSSQVPSGGATAYVPPLPSPRPLPPPPTPTPTPTPVVVVENPPGTAEGPAGHEVRPPEPWQPITTVATTEPVNATDPGDPLENPD